MPAEYVFYEEKGKASSLKQIQHLDQHDGRLHALFHSEKVNGLARLLPDSAVVGKNMPWFNKPAGIGKETLPGRIGNVSRNIKSIKEELLGMNKL